MQGEIDRPAWWQTRAFVLACIVASVLPLLWPALPPLTDMAGHIGRYRIMAEAGVGPLAQHYAVHWAPIGNLGVDALVLALSPVLDVETAAKLIVLLIPALTVAAMLWASREAHGRISPAAGFALPLAYAMPFQLGFVNFALSAALAIGGLALWIRLARTRRDGVRIIVLSALAGPIWLFHSFGWAMLGLFVFGAEIAIRRARGDALPRALALAALCSAPLAWPQALAMIAGAPLVGDTGDWLNLTSKAQWIASLLRERWKVYDVACVIVLALLVWTAIRSKRLSFAGVLGIPALLGMATFILLPRLYAGGAYVDMRVLPYALALALLAIRVAPGEDALARRLAIFGAGFFALRTLTSIIAFALFARGQQAELGAVAQLPQGSTVLVLVDEPSPADWDNPRLGHIAGIGITRARVFSNEQWAISGQQLIRPLHPGAAPFDRDPSQLVFPRGAPYAQTDFDNAIATFDRATFGYVWTIGFPPGRPHTRDLTALWSNGRSTLYRVSRTARLPATAAIVRRS